MNNDFDEFPNVDVRDAFRALRESMNALVAELAIQSADYYCSVAQPADDARGCRETVLWIYQQLFYQPGQDKRSSIYRPGVMACSMDTIALANQVNAAKDRFQSAMQTIKRQHRQALSRELFEDHFARNPGQAEALRRAGLGSVHLKQSYRHIPVLKSTPARIALSWALDTHVVKKISLSEARDYLQYVGAPDASLKIIEAMPSDSFFAQVRKHAPHVRANITYERGLAPAIPATLPILYPVANPAHRLLFKPVVYDPVAPEFPKMPRRAELIDYDNPILESDDGLKGIYPYILQLSGNLSNNLH
jgi:hypothetical protein